MVSVDVTTPEQLVFSLEDLHRGWEVQLLLIAMGEVAVEPLAQFLLGPPSLHPQPRVLAAEALSAIGGLRATQALISALLAGDLATLSDVLRLSEEAVRNCIARELGRLGDPRAIEPLLEALRRFHLVEAGSALAGFGETRAFPLLIECLEDAFIRDRTATAIEAFGLDAVAPLIESLGRRRLRDGEELRPSLERRAESARLLGELGDPRAEAPLAACLTEETPEVRVAAAIALSRLAPDTRGAEVLAALVEGLGSRDAAVADGCAEGLVSIGPAAIPAIVTALKREAAEAGGVTPGPAARRSARILARLATPGVTALVALARDRDPVVRGLAVANLRRGYSAVVERSLLEARRDPDPRVRRTAEAVLANGSRAERARRGAGALSALCGTIRRRLDAVVRRFGHA